MIAKFALKRAVFQSPHIIGENELRYCQTDWGSVKYAKSNG